uniref:Uncharacterized protein n=1 Tax=Candidatus Nitrotoga fabula TaxID=2182327 RepID=A0A2X0R8W0_9PROT|nr:protein of unknown function [Candidatus Nitrotoga fabula]
MKKQADGDVQAVRPGWQRAQAGDEGRDEQREQDAEQDVAGRQAVVEQQPHHRQEDGQQRKQWAAFHGAPFTVDAGSTEPT